MVKLPILSAHDVIKALKKIGFEVVGQKGSHIRLKKKNSFATRIAIVPKHNDIAVGTLKSILRQAGLNREEFLQLIK